MMLNTTLYYRTSKKMCFLALALVLAGCSSNNTHDGFDDGLGSRYGRSGPTTPGSTQDFVQNVGDRIFFETDSSDLTVKAIDTLNKQAQWLSHYTKPSVIVEGHADERGTREYNFALGARRAQIVKDYLASRGVPLQRLKVVSYGKERPLATCNDISCWSQNRRAVTVVGAMASDLEGQTPQTPPTPNRQPWDN
jgi:peptidoglycan-associated lipoprotein